MADIENKDNEINPRRCHMKIEIDEEDLSVFDKSMVKIELKEEVLENNELTIAKREDILCDVKSEMDKDSRNFLSLECKSDRPSDMSDTKDNDCSPSALPDLSSSSEIPEEQSQSATDIQLNELHDSTRKETSFVCVVCCKEFSTSILDNQILEGNGKPCTCGINGCNKCFSRNKLLPNHANSEQPVKNRYSCNDCTKSFKVAHAEGKLWSCDECHKSFKRKQALERHKVTHAEGKPYSCDECHKSFKRKQALERHKVTHAEGKPYSCDECHKSFKRKHYLIQHKVVHTKKKPC